MGKLLVVDDDELLQEFMAAILDSAGYGIIRANNGLEALRLYKENDTEIDLIIMDIIMPQMDGISATKAIREINPSVKVIMISGYSDQIPSYADSFLTKPFRSKDLLEAIRKLLEKNPTT